MSLATFVKRHTGLKVGSGQCVALARKWIAELEKSDDGFDSIPSVASAIDFWDAAPKKKWLHVRPTSKGSSGMRADLPAKGALVIFEPTSGNVHGHVGIALGVEGATGDTFRTFDQNFSVALRSNKETHRMTGVKGWLIYQP